MIKTKEGKLLLLRLSDVEKYDEKKKEYEIVKKYSQLDFPMSLPIDFGICNGGKNIYMLLTWVEGKDLEEVLPELTEEEQYCLGREAGNLIYTNDGAVGVIDFNRWEVGDPYEEFYKLESFGVEISIPYCIGQIEAYFDDKIPEDFWVTLAVYVAHASLYSIKWAEKFGQEEIEGMVERCRRAFEDYENFQRCIPKWYTDKVEMEKL